jgi:hypothetical protein
MVTKKKDMVSILINELNLSNIFKTSLTVDYINHIVMVENYFSVINILYTVIFG